MIEQWKPIKDYEDVYEVSDHGRIKSLDRHIISKDGRKIFIHGRIIKLISSKITQRHPKPMYHVELWKNGKRKVFMIHRLVAEAFIPNPENKPQVNHIDGNRLNNHVSNLEWNTNSENMHHAYKTGLTKPRNAKKIQGINIKTGESVIFESAYMAGRKLQCNPDAIRSALKGRSKTSFGFVWKYV